MAITGNESVTILPLDEENIENEIKNGNENASIPTPPNNDVVFDIPNVKVIVPRSDEED